MKKHAIALAALLGLAPFAANAEGADGKALVEKDCQGCHDNRIYTRPNRIIHSLEDLENRVRFCENQNGKHWSEAQIEAVVQYLNRAYYRFR